MKVLHRSKLLIAVALSVSVLYAGQPALYASKAASSAPASTIATQDISSSEYAAFLQDKFGLSLPAKVTRGEFIVDLARATQLDSEPASITFKDLPTSSPYYDAARALYQKGWLASDTVNASAPLSAVNAVQFAVRASGLQELAYTYPRAKAEQAVSKLPLKTASLSLQTVQELAVAVDTGLLPSSYYAQLKSGSIVTADLASLLIGRTLEFRGQFKHYLGYASDPDIYAKLTNAYNSSVIIQSEKLRTIVDTALEQGLITGYNLKDSRYESNFIDSLSLVYGHSDLKHALQLIGLLRSEGIDAKVQFEPKTSAFVYLKEWGNPGVSEQYEVRQIANGNYIEYAKEYDLALEFGQAADKQRFDAIVTAYAKKNEEDQPGLIAGSWWQPLYYSLTPLADYKVITNNKIQIDRYYAQSFSLKEQSRTVIEGFKKVDPSVQVDSYDFWVDVPFFNYLNGESS